MPNNLTLIPVPPNTWVDLYDLSGIEAGQPIIVENAGVCDLYLTVQATEPPKDHKAYNILKRDDDIRLANNLGDPGAWAFCNAAGGLISVAVREGFQPLLRSALHDGQGSPIGSLEGAVNVHVADVHYLVINQYVHQDTAISSTLAAPSAINDYQITLVDASGFAAGDYTHVNTAEVETTHPRIVSIVGDVCTLDRRLDLAHDAGAGVNKVIVDMALAAQPAGTLAAPQEYFGGPDAGAVWHITRLLLTLIHGTAGDLGLFGNLTALLNGVLIRVKINGQYGTLTNWKTNADIKLDMFDVDFDARSGGQGDYGTSGRGAFSATGAVLRLDGDLGDRLEVYVQDDIRALGFFAMKIQGHVEAAQ